MNNTIKYNLTMYKQKWRTILINLLGGLAVLGSYGYGLRMASGTVSAMWGGVPEWLLPFYQFNMLLAAIGYFAVTYFIVFRLNPNEVSIANRFGFGVFDVLYALILLPSALWMPLTIAMLEKPSSGLWLGICLALDVVGLASIGVVGALLSLRQRKPAWAYWAAVIGSIAFSVQTALLDALIWTAFFPLS